MVVVVVVELIVVVGVAVAIAGGRGGSISGVVCYKIALVVVVVGMTVVAHYNYIALAVGETNKAAVITVKAKHKKDTSVFVAPLQGNSGRLP